mmetsp:Transcript_26063/g.29637  ORF Transcript_26063/g.29637 Transcript_26063/m.29637 type:complete len:214 (+) Transcript_26063:47-688(+)
MATNENDSKANDGNNIIDPRETDVLCGRGGAALRHSGNQTYRRLVNLNKGLYITCLKTEKLKISRSIVAAIREQNGRFLERNAKLGVWCDIGDKKAIEKTSQALREGQPKLRKQMVERGEIPSDQLIGTDHVQQQYGNGIYNPRRQQQQQQQHEQNTSIQQHQQYQWEEKQELQQQRELEERLLQHNSDNNNRYNTWYNQVCTEKDTIITTQH